MKTAFFQRVINRIIMRGFTVSSIPNTEKIIYLTFDDGPEEGITEFVLDELKKYGFKGTFFCKGDCARVHKDLTRKIEEQGHCVGNHTYSHRNTYEIGGAEYVYKADEVLHSILFRPPNGCFTWYNFGSNCVNGLRLSIGL